MMKNIFSIKILFLSVPVLVLTLLFPAIAWPQDIATYTEAIRQNPNDAIAFYNRGLAFAARQEFENAIADYTEAIRLNPNFADAFNNRGNAHFNIREFDKAIADYEAALRIEPTHTIARTNLTIARQQYRQQQRERRSGLWFFF
ncbi:MAG: tetratricopeptide repeat protein [Spirochaetaceae bacterium]|nr:tetratricopeptide repeat protein [Spirochaetaceae bacterium]